MNKKFLLLIALITFNMLLHAQTIRRKFTLDEHSTILDSAGRKLTMREWQPLLYSGNYIIKRTHPNDTSSYTLFRNNTIKQRVPGNNVLAPAPVSAPVSEEERLGSMPKPAESKFFTTGEKIKPFVVRDIDGNKLKLKDLEGKVVVINFWFIGCPPCRMEMPDLNTLALSYKDDPNVVFIAIALDAKDDIRTFIKDHPLAYHIVEDGSMYASLYRLNLYPTNVVLDKEGKVRFHSTSYYPNNAYWIKKTIEEAK